MMTSRDRAVGIPFNPEPPEAEEEREPICPVCGKATDTFYKSNITHDIVGCFYCIDSLDAWDYIN